MQRLMIPSSSKNKRGFEDPPDLSHQIDVYFKNKEECQSLSVDGEIPISEAEMVMQVHTHLGATGLINNKYLVWNKKAAVERKWAPVKKYFRAEISDIEGLNKLATGEDGLAANAAVADKSTEQQVHEEMAEKLGEPFDTLAMAATEKTTP